MAKHMAGKNQRPYSAEDRARRAAKADPRSAASELTPETLYAKQSSQSEKRVPSSIENLHFTPKSPKNGPEGFEETREYPAPAAPQQEAPRSARLHPLHGRSRMRTKTTTKSTKNMRKATTISRAKSARPSCPSSS